MVSREVESEFKRHLRESMSLRGLRSNYVSPPRNAPSPNYHRFLVEPWEELFGWPNPRTLIEHNGSANASRLCHKFAIPVKSEGLKRWLEEQAEYLRELSERDAEILSSYTQVGDRLINHFLRGTLGDLSHMLTHNLNMIRMLGFFIYDQYDFYASRMALPHKDSLITPRGTVDVFILEQLVARNLAFMRSPANIATLLIQYKEELTRIIEEAPRLPNPLIVYRGFQDERYLSGLKFENPDFISTSVSIEAALNFAQLRYEMYPKRHFGSRYLGGVYEITLGPTIPCIYMEPITQCEDEFEILLPPGLQFTFDSKIHYKVLPHAYARNLLHVSGAETRVGIVHTKVELQDPVRRPPPLVSSVFVHRDAKNSKDAKNAKKRNGHRRTKRNSNK